MMNDDEKQLREVFARSARVPTQTEKDALLRFAAGVPTNTRGTASKWLGRLSVGLLGTAATVAALVFALVRSEGGPAEHAQTQERAQKESQTARSEARQDAVPSEVAGSDDEEVLTEGADTESVAGTELTGTLDGYGFGVLHGVLDEDTYDSNVDQDAILAAYVDVLSE